MVSRRLAGSVEDVSCRELGRGKRGRRWFRSSSTQHHGGRQRRRKPIECFTSTFAFRRQDQLSCSGKFSCSVPRWKCKLTSVALHRTRL